MPSPTVATAPSTRRPRKDAAANRSVILAAAADTLAKDPHASIDAIARAAGLSRRALYGHFDDRDALVHEVIQAGAQRFNAIAATVDTSVDARVGLALLSLRLWDEASHILAGISLALDQQHVEATGAALVPLRSTVVAIVTHGQRAGVLRTDLDALTVARLIESAVRGVAQLKDASAAVSRSVVACAVLSMAGLSWRETADLFSTHPEWELSSCASH